MFALLYIIIIIYICCCFCTCCLQLADVLEEVLHIYSSCETHDRQSYLYDVTNATKLVVKNLLVADFSVRSNGVVLLEAFVQDHTQPVLEVMSQLVLKVRVSPGSGNTVFC